jgi:hypothetical protein
MRHLVIGALLVSLLSASGCASLFYGAAMMWYGMTDVSAKEQPVYYGSSRRHVLQQPAWVIRTATGTLVLSEHPVRAHGRASLRGEGGWRERARRTVGMLPAGMRLQIVAESHIRVGYIDWSWLVLKPADGPFAGERLLSMPIMAEKRTFKGDHWYLETPNPDWLADPAG